MTPRWHQKTKSCRGLPWRDRSVLYSCALLFFLFINYPIFALFFQRSHDKKDMYNLNEEEELTHYGQSLAEIEQLNDAVGSDDETEERGLLSGALILIFTQIVKALIE